MTPQATTAPKLTAKAIAGLTAIALAVLADPKHYTTSWFFHTDDDGGESGCFAFFHAKNTLTPRMLKNRIEKHKSWTIFDGMQNHPFFKAAQKDLNLTEEQALELFGATYRWPDKYQAALGYIAGSDKKRARVGYNRIQAFIKQYS